MYNNRPSNDCNISFDVEIVIVVQLDSQTSTTSARPSTRELITRAIWTEPASGVQL